MRCDGAGLEIEAKGAVHHLGRGAFPAVLSLFPERPWRKLALGWASLAWQHFVTGAHALRDPLFILPGHRRLAGSDVRLGIEGLRHGSSDGRLHRRWQGDGLLEDLPSFLGSAKGHDLKLIPAPLGLCLADEDVASKGERLRRRHGAPNLSAVRKV